MFPVPLATTTRQVVLREGVRLDPELAGEVVPDGDRDPLAVAGEPTFHLEELQHDGEAKSTTVGAVGQQFQLFDAQRPVLGEFLLVPVSFHDALPIAILVRSQERANGTPSRG